MAEGKNEYEDLAKEIVRQQLEASRKAVAQQETNEQQRKAALPSWAQVALGVTGLLVLVGGSTLSIRDGVRDVQAAQVTLLKTVADHETRLKYVETKNSEYEILKDTRGQRLSAVEEATKTNSANIGLLQQQNIEIKASQSDIKDKLDLLIKRR